MSELNEDLIRNRVTAVLRLNGHAREFEDLETLLDGADAEPLTEAEVARVMARVQELRASDETSVKSDGSSGSFVPSVPYVSSTSERPFFRHSVVAVVAAVFIAVGIFLTQQSQRTEVVSMRTGPANAIAQAVPPIVKAPALIEDVLLNWKPLEVRVGETVQTGDRERRQVVLPDGSKLSLNAGTKITVVAERRVKVLSGEVFAEVNSEPQGDGPLPFVVETLQRDVTALGTKFAVKADKDSGNVVVTQGKVRVENVGFRSAKARGANDERDVDTGSAGDQTDAVLATSDAAKTQSVFAERKPTIINAGEQLALATLKAEAAPRASHSVGWTRDLMTTPESVIVPKNPHAGGSVQVVDPNGQEMNLSLRQFHVDVHIEDGFARTTIDQTYFNHTWQRLEGTFRFPLPADASLSRLAMYVNGKLMEGGMVERNYGRNVFEQVMHTRRDPALLEWIDGSTFQMRVFPLEARQEKRIVLSYSQRLPSDYGRSTYRFPAGHSLEGVGEWSAEVRLKGGAAKAGEEEKIQTGKSGRPTLAWHSPSHVLSASNDGSDLVLRDREKYSLLDRDLVVEFDEVTSGIGFQPVSQTTSTSERPSNSTTKDQGRQTGSLSHWRFSEFEQEGYRYLRVRYRPELLGGEQQRQSTKPARHWVFLVENSADRDHVLAKTQQTIVSTLLEHVEHGDSFTLIRAGTKPELFRGKPVACSKKNVAAAMEFLKAKEPIGALDLGAALGEVERACRGQKDSIIVHVGSGIAVLGETDESTLLRKVGRAGSPSYVGIAVGKRWSKSFMQNAAERTRGMVTQINPDEAVAWRAFELLSTFNAPRLVDVAFECEQPGVTFLPFERQIADGQEVAAVTRLPAGAQLPRRVTVKGSVIGGHGTSGTDGTQGRKSVAFTQALEVRDVAQQASYLPRTWARLEIDRLVALGAEEHKNAIIDLSKAMYVMSPFTSLLVLEDEAMYEQFKVDRGRKDHWAMYTAPAEIKVVTEEAVANNDPLEGVRSKLVEQAKKWKAAREQLDTAIRERRSLTDVRTLARKVRVEVGETRRLAERVRASEQTQSDSLKTLYDSVLQMQLWQQWTPQPVIPVTHYWADGNWQNLWWDDSSSLQGVRDPAINRWGQTPNHWSMRGRGISSRPQLRLTGDDFIADDFVSSLSFPQNGLPTRFGIRDSGISGIRSDVSVESMEDVGVMILKGNQSEVDSVLSIIHQVEELRDAGALALRKWSFTEYNNGNGVLDREEYLPFFMRQPSPMIAGPGPGVLPSLTFQFAQRQGYFYYSDNAIDDDGDELQQFTPLELGGLRIKQSWNRPELLTFQSMNGVRNGVDWGGTPVWGEHSGWDLAPSGRVLMSFVSPQPQLFGGGMNFGTNVGFIPMFSKTNVEGLDLYNDQPNVFLNYSGHSNFGTLPMSRGGSMMGEPLGFVRNKFIAPQGRSYRGRAAEFDFASDFDGIPLLRDSDRFDGEGINPEVRHRLRTSLRSGLFNINGRVPGQINLNVISRPDVLEELVALDDWNEITLDGRLVKQPLDEPFELQQIGAATTIRKMFTSDAWERSAFEWALQQDVIGNHGTLWPNEFDSLAKLRKPVSVNCENKQLSTVVQEVLSGLGLGWGWDNAAMAAPNGNVPITVQLNNVPASECLRQILEPHGMSFIVQPGNVRVVAKDEARKNWINRAERVRPLVEYAPGLRTSQADRLAVLEAEGGEAMQPRRGSVAKDAATLINKARARGWEEVTLRSAAGSDRAGSPCYRVDGSGRFMLDRTLESGLSEQLRSDGLHSWSLYPEISLGAKRTLSRFHREEFSSFVPWLVPSAEDLSIGGDVTLVSERVIRITPKTVRRTSSPSMPKNSTTDGLEVRRTTKSVEAKDAESVTVYVELEFDAEARLVERRICMAKDGEKDVTTITRVTYSADGLVRVFGREKEPLVECRFERKAIEAPQFMPQTKGLVVLPLPYRDRSHMGFELVRDERTPEDIANNRNGKIHFDRLSDEQVMQLVANCFAQSDQPLLVELVKSRRMPLGDVISTSHRDEPDGEGTREGLLGYAVLLSSLHQSAAVSDLVGRFPDSALGRYLEHCEMPLANYDLHREFVPMKSASPFIKRLCATHNFTMNWASGRYSETLRLQSAKLIEQIDRDWEFVERELLPGDTLSPLAPSGRGAVGEGLPTKSLNRASPLTPNLSHHRGEGNQTSGVEPSRTASTAVLAQRWSMLLLMAEAIDRSPPIDNAVWLHIAEKAAAFEGDPLLQPLVRETRLLWFARAGRLPVELLRHHLTEAFERGSLAPLNAELRQAVVDAAGSDAWMNAVNVAFRSAKERLEAVALTEGSESITDLPKKHFRGAKGDYQRAAIAVLRIELANRCFKLGDVPLAWEQFNAAIEGQSLDENRWLLYRAFEFYRLTNDFKAAEALMPKLIGLKDDAAKGTQATEKSKKLQRIVLSAEFWKTAADVAEHVGDDEEALRRREHAYEIEFAQLPEQVNSQEFQNGYVSLFDRYLKLAPRVSARKPAEVDEFAARVRKAAQRWMSIAPDDAVASEAAAKVFMMLGRWDTAWEYWTVPAAQAPDRSTVWQLMAQKLEQHHRVNEADSAWLRAIECEPTNPDLLEQRAALQGRLGQHGRERQLLDEIVTGKWQPRFAPTVERAKQKLAK